MKSRQSLPPSQIVRLSSIKVEKSYWTSHRLKLSTITSP